MKISLSIPIATIFVLIATIFINIIGLWYSLDKYFPTYRNKTQAQIQEQFAISPEKLQAFFAVNSLDDDTQEDYQSALTELSHISSSLESLSQNPELYVKNDDIPVNDKNFQITQTTQTTQSDFSHLEGNISTLNILEVFNHPFSFSRDSDEGKFIYAILRNFLILNGFWLVFVTIFYIFWTRRMFRPIHLIIENLKNFSKWTSSNILYKKRDEFSPLIATLNELHASLNQQEKIRNQFLSDLSHEIRTPMTSISCLLEAIDDGVMTLDKNTIIILQNEMRRLVEITEHIMKSENFLSDNPLHLKREKFIFEKIFTEILLQYQPKLAKNSQKILVNFKKNEKIFMNKEYCIQILHNIFSNFCKYAGENSSLTVSLEKQKNFFTLIFSDNGKGVRDEDLPFLVEKFFRSDTGRTQKVDDLNMGIGLSLVEKIAHIHGGKLEISKTEPHWLTILLTFSYE